MSNLLVWMLYIAMVWYAFDLPLPKTTPVRVLKILAMALVGMYVFTHIYF